MCLKNIEIHKDYFLSEKDRFIRHDDNLKLNDVITCTLNYTCHNTITRCA